VASVRDGERQSINQPTPRFGKVNAIGAKIKSLTSRSLITELDKLVHNWEGSEEASSNGIKVMLQVNLS
jgi:hypothetical protein